MNPHSHQNPHIQLKRQPYAPLIHPNLKKFKENHSQSAVPLIPSILPDSASQGNTEQSPQINNIAEPNFALFDQESQEESAPPAIKSSLTRAILQRYINFDNQATKSI